MTDSAINRDKPMAGTAQPWLSSALFDLSFIIGPAFVASIFVIIFHEQIQGYDFLPLWAWVVFVLMIDVAHVYSTLFRTYLDPVAFSNNRTLLISIPVLAWAVGTLLYSVDGMLFWRALAYLAVFHFIRQQFGFVALYSRKDYGTGLIWNSWNRRLDALAIYMATLYPIFYWHTHLPRNFNWFVAGDFFVGVPDVVSKFVFIAYLLVGAAYLLKEAVQFLKTGYFNLPKNLIVVGTALAWWIGIVALNSDMAFTITNVITHGIPYIALVWLYHNRVGKGDRAKDSTKNKTKNSTASSESNLSMVSNIFVLFRNLILSYLPAFLVFLVLLAYLEEGLWDGFVWREHGTIFGIFQVLPVLKDPLVLSILIPFLALPQSTHYVLDGFIWRIKDTSKSWSI